MGTSAVTIWNTVRATGPFASPDVYQGLVLLQIFMGVLACTELLLAAAMTEQQTSERRRGAAHAVGEVLVDAPTVASAAPAILRNVCEKLEWQTGAFWLIDPDVRQLRCMDVWSNGAPSMAGFEQATRERLFERGTGLPGRVWAKGAAVWIEDVQRDPNFPRAPAARAAGLHGAFGFPICLEREVVGVIEFFTNRVATPDDELLDTMSVVGNQVGQFIGRKRVETAARASEERLRDADQRKDEFLAMLAHELRNPLAPIRTGLELIRLAGDAPGMMEQVRPMMERQVGHMVRLIDDLMDVSRITSGKIQLQRKLTALEDLVCGAVEANRVGIEAAGARLTVQLTDPRTELWVDPTRFVQVLSNLLHNAAKFTDAGGQIMVRGAVVEDALRGNELVLSVSDTGIGISSEMLPRVFDLFSQGDRSAHRPQPGLGIGLALARRIVEMHGGRIEARSAGPECGSEFTIYLPVLRVAEDLSTGTASAVLMRHAVRRRVLVVDDNADAADTLAALVDALGGESRTAADGAGAIQCAMDFSPDVILLDIGMPGMDGYETCRRIRQHASGRRVFMIAITGWGQDGDKLRATEAGFDAHLTKPADPAVLERLLAEASRAIR
jgi:signal transduction histidine kinase/CheY-like chemotaxis protein